MKYLNVLILVLVGLFSACDYQKVEEEIQLTEEIPDCIPEEKRDRDYMSEIGIPSKHGLAKLLGLPLEDVHALKVAKSVDASEFSGEAEDFSPDFIKKIDGKYWVAHRYSNQIMIMDENLNQKGSLYLNDFGDSADIVDVEKYDNKYYCSWVNDIATQSKTEYRFTVFSSDGQEEIKNNFNILSFAIIDGKIYDPEQYKNDNSLFNVYDLDLKLTGIAGENIFRDIKDRSKSFPVGPYALKNELKLIQLNGKITAHSVNFPWAAEYNYETGKTRIVKYQGEIFRIIEKLYFDRLEKDLRDAFIFFWNVKEFKGEVYIIMGLPYRDVFIQLDSNWKPRKAWYYRVRCKLSGIKDFEVTAVANKTGFIVAASNGYVSGESKVELLTY